MIWRRGERGSSLFPSSVSWEHGTPLHAEGETEHGCHNAFHCLSVTCDFSFSPPPRRNKLKLFAAEPYFVLLHGCLDCKDFLWVGKRDKRRGDNASQLDRLQEEQYTSRYRLFPPSFPQPPFSTAASLYLSTIALPGVSRLKSHGCAGGQGHREHSAVSRTVGWQPGNLTSVLISAIPLPQANSFPLWHLSIPSACN